MFYEYVTFMLKALDSGHYTETLGSLPKQTLQTPPLKVHAVYIIEKAVHILTNSINTTYITTSGPSTLCHVCQQRPLCLNVIDFN